MAVWLMDPDGPATWLVTLVGAESGSYITVYYSRRAQWRHEAPLASRGVRQLP